MNTTNEVYQWRRPFLLCLRGKGALSKSVQLMATVLMVSGIFHLCLFALADYRWEGQISPRKPALFGVSAGLTVCSLVWCCRVLGRDRQFQRVLSATSWSLLFEVALITLQYWRGVPSHFNRSTWLDASIETVMVTLVVGVTVGIAWMCWFSMNHFAVDAGKLFALRAGLSLLLLSCLLGFATMFAGEHNLAVGQPVETWGRAGVLKYPHGAVLHALQTLPILNWGLTQLNIRRRFGLLTCAVAAHLVFLLHAIWQTCRGRARLDVDFTGGVLLVIAVIMFVLPVVAIIVYGMIRVMRPLQKNVMRCNDFC